MRIDAMAILPSPPVHIAKRSHHLPLFCHPLPQNGLPRQVGKGAGNGAIGPQTRRTPWVARVSRVEGGFSNPQTPARNFHQQSAAAADFSLLSLSSLSSLAREERNKRNQRHRLARVASKAEQNPFPELPTPPHPNPPRQAGGCDGRQVCAPAIRPPLDQRGPTGAHSIPVGRDRRCCTRSGRRMERRSAGMEDGK